MSERPGPAHTSLVLVIAFGAAFAGLASVLDTGAWWLLLTVLAIAVFGTGSLARALALPTAVSAIVPLLAVVTVIVARFAAPTAVLGMLPTPATAERFVDLSHAASVSIAWGITPVDADEGIQFVLALGMAGLLLLAELLAFVVRRPPLAGVPLLAVLLVPSLTPDARVEPLAFIATAAAFLWLLVGGRLPQRRAGTVLGIGAIAITAGLAIPVVLPDTQRAPASDALGPTLATGVNPLLRLGDDLRRNDDRVVVTYTTSSGDPYYLRLTEIVDFSGEAWGPEPPQLDPRNRPEAIPLEQDRRRVAPEREIGVVIVGNLLSPWLPIPYPATSVHELVGDWQYVPESRTIASNTSLAVGETYTVRSDHLAPTPEQLNDSGSSVPAGFERYLELPDTPQRVVDAAHEATAGETSAYARAVAIQEYLRAPTFRYSTYAPVNQGFDGTGMDALAAFLDARAGYCIHFASAMATMARIEGIPARIIVGFQPGERTSGVQGAPNVFEVTSNDLHAWPELYFEGVGWIAFEPTPSRGNVPDYARRTTEGVPQGVAGTPGEAAPPSDRGLDGDASTAGSRSDELVDWGALITAGLLALGAGGLALIPAGARMLRRRRRFAAVRTGTREAHTAWSELLDTARDVGLATPATLTPRALVHRLGTAAGMTDAARGALERLAAALERERYGPPDDLAATRHGEDADVTDLALVVGAFTAGLDRGERWRSRLLPASLWGSRRDLA